ncbi:MAG: tetratricopeptide repeat protein [Myxococcales bacterium]|nr:tetratricopeptide repeat protein [Myxococcales bacterium]
MIVTCPACSSRYKLDESKVTARGAKITCPKCKHVFVVYPGGTTGPLPDASGDSPKSSRPPNLASGMAAALEQGVPGDNEWDEEPTRIGMQKVPDLRRPLNPTLATPAEPQVIPLTSAEAATRSQTLDFKKVGVSTWKVKVKIGLIYDFSDIKTLRKYIQDGRVTNQDVISYDGKIWKGLGEIPDLDIFFVQIWEDLNLAKSAEPAEHVATPLKKAPADDGKEPSASEAQKPVAAATSPFKDPFAQKAARQKTAAPVKKKVGSSSGSTTSAVGGLIVLLLLAAGWYYTIGPGVPQPPPPQVVVAPPEPAKEPSIEQQIKDKLRPVDPPGAELPVDEPDVTADNDGNGRPDNLRPINRTQPPPSPLAGQRPLTPGPSGALQRGAPSPQGASTSQQTMTSADAASAGEDATRRNDWSGAVSAYGQAVALDPKSGTHRYKLGNAQLRAGQPDEASVTLQEAAQLGSKDAWKLLGQIAKDNGDNPGASGYYQKYLATKPQDAAAIEKILQTLQGG